MLQCIDFKEGRSQEGHTKGNEQIQRGREPPILHAAPAALGGQQHAIHGQHRGAAGRHRALHGGGHAGLSDDLQGGQLGFNLADCEVAARKGVVADLKGGRRGGKDGCW